MPIYFEISRDGNNVVAINTETAEIVYSLPDALSVIHACRDNVINNEGGGIHILGGWYEFGTNNLSLPNTMPAGYEFICDKSTIFHYTGTGDAVYIDSNYLADICLGQVLGNANCENGVHIKPTGVSPQGETVMVVSKLYANRIEGCKHGILCDNTVGNICDNEIHVNAISNSGSIALDTDAVGIKVVGSSPQICQGNMVKVVYLQSGNNYLNNHTWTGLEIGSSTFGATPVNVNIWKILVDGMNVPNSMGVDTWGACDLFEGAIVDVTTGVKLETGSSQNLGLYSKLSVLTNGTPVIDNGDGTNYTAIAGNEWQGNPLIHGSMTLDKTGIDGDALFSIFSKAGYGAYMVLDAGLDNWAGFGRTHRGAAKWFLGERGGDGEFGIWTKNPAANDYIQRIKVNSGTALGAGSIDYMENLQPCGNVTVVVKTKAGAPTDADFTNPKNGMVVIDTLGNKIWVRVGANTWKSSPLT